MSQADKQEFEELSIGTVSGLQAFLRNAQTQYNIGLEKETKLIGEGNYDYGDSLNSAFQTVRNQTNKLISNLQSGGEVSHGDANTLQNNYDKLVNLIKNPPSQSPKEFKNEPEVDIKEPEISREELSLQELEEDVSVRPKVGSLKVSSHDYVSNTKEELKIVRTTKDISLNEEVTRKKKRKRRKKKQRNTVETSKTSVDSSGIEHILRQSREKYSSLKKAFPNPNTVQSMLFEEVHEGIEQLEIILKMPTITDKHFHSASEISSHIKYALSAIEEGKTKPEMVQEQQVPVVTEQAGELMKKTEVSNNHVSFVPTSVTTNNSSTVKRPIPKQLQTLPKPESIHELESLTDLYLTAPRYRHFIEENYSTPASFEKILDATVTKIEADTIDQIEKWLGDVPASAFAFIKDMTITELAQFAGRSYEAVFNDLQRENVKYETFAGWRDLVDEMLDLVPNGESMKFGQLFAHWMVEMALQDDSNSQSV